jgi:integrase
MFKINDLSAFRYSITGMNNVNFGIPGTGYPCFSAPMSTTYADLISIHKLHLKKTCSPKSLRQITSNHVTALRKFLHFNGKVESSQIGDEMHRRFDDCLHAHLDGSGLGPRSQSDRRSLLKLWHDTFSSTKNGPAEIVRGRERRSAESTSPQATPFELGFKAALRAVNLSPRNAAVAAGVSVAALGRWSRGALPNGRSSETMLRVETVLKLQPGTLNDLWKQSLQKKESSIGSNSYRERHKSLISSEYVLKLDSVSAQLTNEWARYFQYKTSLIPPRKLVRASNAIWYCAERAEATSPLTPYNSTSTKYCASAGIAWHKTRSYLGFICLDKKQGGYGRAVSEAQTIAWFAVPEAVDAYLEFMTCRSGQLRHGGHKTTCAMVISLTRATAGYFPQNSELIASLPDDITNGRSWNDLCEETAGVAKLWKTQARDVSRDPAIPLQIFLQDKNPLSLVFSAMDRLSYLSTRMLSGSKAQARAKRDELILGLIISNPLREKNLINLTLKMNNSGSFYKSASGNWRIRLEGRQFKNRNKMDGQTYDVPVAAWLHPMINEYVTIFRKTLIGQGSDSEFLLVSSRDGNRMLELSRQVFKITKEHIPNCPGVGCHAFRHLVATDWLTHFPNDFLTVAELLNDTIEVVLRNYAHLKKDVAFARYEKYVEGAMQRQR